MRVTQCSIIHSMNDGDMTETLTSQVSSGLHQSLQVWINLPVHSLDSSFRQVFISKIKMNKYEETGSFSDIKIYLSLISG